MKINHVLKASKRAVELGYQCIKCAAPIEQGKPYKWAKGRYTHKKILCGSTSCQFSRADLTSSEKLSRLYGAQETAEDVVANWEDGLQDLESFLTEAAEAAREVAEEYAAAAEAMGAAGGQNTERAELCEAWADELEGVGFDEFDEEAVKKGLFDEISPGLETPLDGPDDEHILTLLPEKKDEWAQEQRQLAKDAVGTLEL